MDYFGGRNNNLDFQNLSNIVFSNGDLDPWSAGGVIEDIKGNSKVTVLFIKDSAHHLDLRLPNPADPKTVQDARDVEREQISKWVEEY